MTPALGVAALVFTGIALVLLIVLGIRRIVLDRNEGEYLAALQRVRPKAIVLVEGERQERPELPPDDQAVLADVLSRYSRQLTGAAEERIAEYFLGIAALATRCTLPSHSAIKKPVSLHPPSFGAG